ncbi:hypothetical protein B0H17DRAFT_1137773 [Mycena rosella]|uniref:Beta-lactamase-related domain-containing protein n=1 Tax=Mycena rosella TaxID=1033263 RepID=A0AAD7D7S8_MYCRO|nr:hypothetical protein B0H17DRAFT_1137773 [Mycena rosella]
MSILIPTASLKPTKMSFLAAARGERLRWDTKIKNVLSEWGLMDEEMQNGVMIQDMLSHRTGMPRHDFSGFARKGDVSEMISVSATVGGAERTRPGDEKMWAGAAGVLTSSRDLATWVSMLLNKGRHPTTIGLDKRYVAKWVDCSLRKPFVTLIPTQQEKPVDSSAEFYVVFTPVSSSSERCHWDIPAAAVVPHLKLVARVNEARRKPAPDCFITPFVVSAVPETVDACAKKQGLNGRWSQSGDLNRIKAGERRGGSIIKTNLPRPSPLQAAELRNDVQGIQHIKSNTTVIGMEGWSTDLVKADEGSSTLVALWIVYQICDTRNGRFRGLLLQKSVSSRELTDLSRDKKILFTIEPSVLENGW